MLIEDLPPGNPHSPGEQRATDYLEGCGLQVLDRNWKQTDGRLKIVAAGRDALAAAGARRPRNGRYRPPHDISYVRQRQLRLHATAGVTAHGKRFVQLRTGIASAWNRTSAYSTEHLRRMGKP